MSSRLAVRSFQSRFFHIPHRSFSSSRSAFQHQQPSPHTNFYKSHGRALFKSLTLAFLSYQIFYWAWLTLEMETLKDEKGREIKALEEEVKLLSSGQGSHVLDGKRILDEKKELKEQRG